ncbi:MAG: flagellar hook-length control protein FliK [Gemmata sp.]
MRVQLDGVEQVATAAEPLAPGGRYLLQVERNSVGVRLSPPPESVAAAVEEVATAVLRAPAPTLTASLKPLQAELAQLAASPKAGIAPAPVIVRDAAAAVTATLQTILPGESRPPDATQLRQLVENGGLHYEAKLARLAGAADAPAADSPVADSRTQPAAEKTTPAQVGPYTTPKTKGESDLSKSQAGERAPAVTDARAEAAPARSQAATDPGRAPDLKGDLLRLLQAVNDLGGAARAPAAEAAVRGIEAQQAANVLAQSNNAPYFLQVPFPDAGEWRTLRLSLEPQHRPDEQAEADRAGRFRVFMHVPLTDLGETWIDAGLSGESFRATIYLDRSAVRDRVRAQLPELQAELAAEGFSEVLLDVRPSGELPSGRRRDAGAVQAGRPGSVSVLDVRA